MVFYFGMEDKSAFDLSEVKTQREKEIDKEKLKIAKTNKINSKEYALKKGIAIFVTAMTAQLILEI